MPSTVIVIGASAGGLQTLSSLLNELPEDFPATILIVLHISPNGLGLLPEILQKNCRLPIKHPVEGEMIKSGHVYIAPPNKHMVINQDDKKRISLTHGPRVNRSRPAVDPLFRSAAVAYSKNVIGIVLTGLLDDGTVGLIAIKKCGGVVMVQDPQEAEYPDMPLSVLQNIAVDYCLPVTQIAEVITRLALERTIERKNIEEHVNLVPHMMKVESSIVGGHMSDTDQLDKLGNPSVYTCPECHGTLWQIKEESTIRFRCRVGHAFGIENLAAAQAENVEAALWAALRALEEHASLSRRLAERAEKSQDPINERFRERASDVAEHAALLRQLLLSKYSL